MALDGRATLAPSASLIQSALQCKVYSAKSTAQCKSLQHSARLQRSARVYSAKSAAQCEDAQSCSTCTLLINTLRECKANMFHKYSCDSEHQ